MRLPIEGANRTRKVFISAECRRLLAWPVAGKAILVGASGVGEGERLRVARSGHRGAARELRNVQRS